MSLPRIVLALSGIAFGGFGAFFLVDPEALHRLLRAPSPGALVTVDIAAVYGGLELGLGAFFLVAATRGRWVLPALGAQIMTVGGVVIGRLTGMATQGTTASPLLWLLTGEVAMLALGIVAFRRARVLMARNAGRTYF